MRVCHFLIGVPGSGKSTLATQLAKLGYRIVSTDAIREKIYGDEIIQGDWAKIEEVVLKEIQDAISNGFDIVYDATNAVRPWRMDLLRKLNSIDSNSCQNPVWIAWYLKTPLEICKQWNKNRDRKVPDDVIDRMHKSLKDFPPIAAEGFIKVEHIDVSKPFEIDLQAKIEKLNRSLINRRNRTQHDGISFHKYSKLLDFERLMHLISLIIRFPGIGNLHSSNPNELVNIFGIVPKFTNSVDEITGITNKICGKIYADKDAIESDLHWLLENNLITITDFIDSPCPNSPLAISPSPPFSTHAYSDTEPFLRLIETIRFILENPFLPSNQGSLQTLVSALQSHEIIYGEGRDIIRKDIETVLKPYKILPEFALRQGYFAGTGILSKQELIKVFDVIQSQAKSLDDPLALDIYHIFARRMKQAQLIADSNIYPVRGIAHHSIVDLEYLHETALARNMPRLEEAIAKCELLQLNRFPGRGRYQGDEAKDFTAYPLQIVFYNSAWYLGLECVSGANAGLFRFERLDRLFIGQLQHKQRSINEQKISLQKLQKLIHASVGIFLGYNAEDQRLFLSNKKEERDKVRTTVELWFNDTKFKFISEGTKRFVNVKMSLPLSQKSVSIPKSVFSLSGTKDKDFPNRFRVIFPKWSLQDFELEKWILGFGGNVKVVQPPELVEKIKRISADISMIYK